MKKESKPADPSKAPDKAISEPLAEDSKTGSEPEPQAEPPKKHALLWLMLILAVLLALGAAGAGYLYQVYQRIESEVIPARAQAYELKKGATALTVARDLLDNGVPEPLLRYYLHEHPEYRAVQAGEYLIDGKKTLPKILQDMVDGKILERTYPTFTVVEGSTWPEILAKIGKFPKLDEPTVAVLKTPRKLHEASMEPELLQWVGGSHANLEGLLLPATYPVFDKRPFGAVIAHAMREMALFMRDHWEEKKEGNTLSPYEILTVASIVERETLVDEEKPLVAAVIYNRLRKSMRLQVDPAVMYGVSPTFRGRLTREMLNKDTPYNTYVHEGLPPSPIGMPGKAAILAALNPADSEVLYFVAKGVSPQDGHVFSATLNEHNKAVAAYREKVKAYYKRQAQQSKAQGTSGADGQDKQAGTAQEKGTEAQTEGRDAAAGQSTSKTEGSTGGISGSDSEKARVQAGEPAAKAQSGEQTAALYDSQGKTATGEQSTAMAQGVTASSGDGVQTSGQTEAQAGSQSAAASVKRESGTASAAEGQQKTDSAGERSTQSAGSKTAASKNTARQSQSSAKSSNSSKSSAKNTKSSKSSKTAAKNSSKNKNTGKSKQKTTKQKKK